MGIYLIGDIDTLILDEFDKSIEFGFQEEMAETINHLSDLKKRILLSTTDIEEIPAFTGLGRMIKLDYLVDTADRLHLMKVISPDKDKLETLYRLLCT